MSNIGLWYIGGIIKHAKALAALTNPDDRTATAVSFPGYEAP
jgi:glutamine synthetase